jgi:hypothetical protein
LIFVQIMQRYREVQLQLRLRRLLWPLKNQAYCNYVFWHIPLTIKHGFDALTRDYVVNDSTCPSFLPHWRERETEYSAWNPQVQADDELLVDLVCDVESGVTGIGLLFVVLSLLGVVMIAAESVEGAVDCRFRRAANKPSACPGRP